MPRSRLALAPTSPCYGRICICAAACMCMCARSRSLHSFVHVRAADARASRARGNRSAPTATTSRFEVRQIYAGLLNAREAPFADSAVVTELPTTFRPPTRKHTTALPPLPLPAPFLRPSFPDSDAINVSCIGFVGNAYHRSFPVV